ncbi:hypothetical protein DWG24_10590 [Dickeya zeae]|uniref:Uncharacterized protein n=1 Tax=Dickeya zeae TaxID=204042 RepID=A0AAE6Z0J7_9GAMM|nr:hypothetical protein DWG24_10590 [Dickeya zeae]
MFGKLGFAHGDLLRGHNQYVGRSLKVNGSVYRDTYISTYVFPRYKDSSSGQISAWLTAPLFSIFKG